MRIAIVTGASSGMGREFVLQLDSWEHYDEIWVIARRRERLEELAGEVHTPLRLLALDLTLPEALEQYAQTLREAQPEVKLLVNCAGYGKFGRCDELPADEQLGMIDLNCRALTAVTTLTLPYLRAGSRIVQLDSLSAFQPVPYLAVYAASKAFVLSYSRALDAELRPRGIRCMAVSPGWVQTEFFDRAMEPGSSAVTYFNRVYQASAVVQRARKDLRRGRAVSICGLPVRMQVRAVKLLPHSLVMRIWLRQQKHC